ncbi:hypothetical protein Plhal304r1_c023g0078661 [Plasmopara halstedii]
MIDKGLLQPELWDEDRRSQKSCEKGQNNSLSNRRPPRFFECIRCRTSMESFTAFSACLVPFYLTLFLASLSMEKLSAQSGLQTNTMYFKLE